MKIGDHVTNGKGWHGVIEEICRHGQHLKYGKSMNKGEPLYYVRWKERAECPDSHPYHKAIRSHPILPHGAQQICPAIQGVRSRVVNPLPPLPSWVAG